jgi:CheY-like chemotaxis protein
MARAASYSAESLSGIYVLVVDSDKERRMLIAGILRYCGALVTPIETADAALAVMQLLRPDIIVVDFSNTDELALPLIRGVRARTPAEGGAVVTVAVGDAAPGAERARAQGFDAYIAKPLEPAEFCGLIAELLNR